MNLLQIYAESVSERITTLTFVEVMDKSSVSCFLTDGVVELSAVADRPARRAVSLTLTFSMYNCHFTARC